MRVVPTFKPLEEWAKPVPELEMRASAGYLDARYTDVGLATVVGVTFDREFVKSPEWSFNTGFQYDFAVGRAVLGVGGDWSYRSKEYNDVQKTESLSQPGYGLVSANVSYAPTDGTRTLSLIGTNLTGERFKLNGFSLRDATGVTETFWGAPRTWGVRFQIGFA